ncbi:MAG: FtsX-like permease family protein [Bacilli bacterium]
MKIMNRLTIRYLKENKKRTILTILCIALSVVMISCVGIAFYSGKQFYKEYIEKSEGDYHYTIIDNTQKTIDLIKNDSQIDSYYYSCSEMYYYKDINNPKEQLVIKKGDSKYFDKQSLDKNLITGNLPQSPKEIALSKEYIELNNLNKKIGDSIRFQYTFYEDNQEKTKTYDYKIVGIIKEFKSQSLYVNPFNAISYIDFNNQDFYTIYVKDKELSDNIFDHGNQLKKDVNQLDYHSSYLAIQDIFEENSHSIFLTMYSMIAALLVIIVFISIFIIYQAFNLSTNDRIQYLGMLSSVGATPKQKKRSVYYEGFIMSLISIPLGILMSFIGLSLTFFTISQLDIVKSLGISISAKLSLEYLFLVIFISLMTIFISLYLPARKISKISVIDALKKNDEIKVKSKKLKNGFFSKKFFKINQQLAIKNYRRQGRRSKVIVFSLVISMVSFVGIFGFGVNMFKTAEKAQRYSNYDVLINISDDEKQMNELKSFLDHNSKVDDYDYLTRIYTYAKVDSSYLNIPISLDSQHIGYTQFNLVGVSDSLYSKICDENNIKGKEKQAIAINYPYTDNDVVKKFYKKMDNKFLTSFIYQDDNKVVELPLFDSIEMINEDKYNLSYFNFCLVVPIKYVYDIDKSSYNSVEFMVYSSQHEELTKDLEDAHYSSIDYAATVERDRQMFTIIQVFIYGFVLIMILFTLMNIVNMMSASINKRKKEFAMMLSVGMSPKGIKKMILNESFIYGLKTLLYGIPLSILVELWLYIKTYGQNAEIPFQISYLAYIISFIMIMIVMVITFRVGLRQLKKQNIIESLKEDM